MDALHKITISMTKNTRNVWPVLFILTLLGGLGAPARVYAKSSIPRFTHLTSENGLSHNEVQCILQDYQGFMWFGTLDGLNRYDGYTFTIYHHRRSDSNSLSHNAVTALYEDRLGTLWVGTVAGLDSYVGGERFTHYPAISEQVGAIYEDAAGMLWIGTESAGLFRYDRAAGQFTQYTHDPINTHSLSDDAVRVIYEDRMGTLWVGTAYGGLNAFDRTTERFTPYRHDPADRHSLSYDRVTTIYEDRSGILWIGTGSDYEVNGGGLNAFDRTAGQASEVGAFTRYLHNPQDHHSLSNNHVKVIYQDQAGTLWIGTDDGLNVFSYTTNTFGIYRHDPLNPYSLGDGPVTAIYEDRAGALWFGTKGAGVSRYARVKEKFTRYQSDPLDSNSVLGPAVGGLYEDHAGILWIGVAGEGLDSLDRSTGQFTHYTYDPADPHSLSNNNVRALYEDHEGALWVGTNLGLDRFVSTEGTFVHYVHDPDDPSSLGPGAVKVILEDQAHALWVATEEPGTLNRFDRNTGTFRRYEHDSANPDGFINTYGVRAIHEDRAGDLWLGTYSGLVHFDRETEKFTQYRHDPANPQSLSNDFIWSIHEDVTGNFWLGTDEGLNRFDRATQQFAAFTVEDGLPSDKVICILADEQGSLWLGTSGGGLSRFDLQMGFFKNYDVSDGLASNVLLIGACHQSERGEMFFGTANGFNTFYPADVKDNPYIPPIVLTAFRKFNEVVEFDVPLSAVDEITLSYKDNFFAFEFAALDYTDPTRNQYAYQLEGFDEGWIDCGTRRYASYTNLPPGDYTFHVKGANNDGLWNETGRAVQIMITPPFWETWWFRIGVVVVALGALTAVIKTRMRHVAVLTESAERFRALFENVPLCVFELDMTSTPPRIVRANRRSERVYGWSVAEFADISLDQIFAPDARIVLQGMINMLDPGETITAESIGLRADRTAFPVRVSATGEAVHGLKRVILAIEDVTAEKGRRSEEEAIAEERRRIAREIHDGLAQDLAGLRFEVGRWHKLVDADPAQMHTELDSLQDLLTQNIREVRRSIFALRPVALAELGFYPALQQFTGEFGEQNQLHVDLRIAGPQQRLPVSLEPVLFRIIQEALNNIGKHAQASTVWIELNMESPEAVTLTARDDGKGFDPAILERLFQRGHLGLKQMQERIENLKGAFELHSRPGSGTEIKIVLPLVTQSRTVETQGHPENKMVREER